MGGAAQELRDLGRALGFDVWVAASDRARAFGAGRLGDGYVESLPAPLSEIDSVPLILGIVRRCEDAE